MGRAAAMLRHPSNGRSHGADGEYRAGMTRGSHQRKGHGTGSAQRLWVYQASDVSAPFPEPPPPSFWGLNPPPPPSGGSTPPLLLGAQPPPHPSFWGLKPPPPSQNLFFPPPPGLRLSPRRGRMQRRGGPEGDKGRGCHCPLWGRGGGWGGGGGGTTGLDRS